MCFILRLGGFIEAVLAPAVVVPNADDDDDLGEVMIL